MTEIVKGLSYEAYAARPGLTATDLKNARISPLRYRWCRDHKPAPSPAMELGAAAHCAILTPDKFAAEYIAYAGTRRGNNWDLFCLTNETKTILSRPDYDSCLAMAEAVRRHPAAAPHLKAGEPEVSIFWTESGVPYKCRMDWLNDAIVELKTTADPTPRAFANQSYKLGYHLQYAWYLRGLVAAGLEPRPIFVVAIESKQPHDVVVYTIDDLVIAEGRAEIATVLTTLDKCRAKQEWPGCSTEPLQLMIPAWVYKDTEETTLTIGGEEVTL